MECGPDTLINCLSINFKGWDSDNMKWTYNTSMEKQREFLAKFYKRCSHSYEKPSMVDRGRYSNQHIFISIFPELLRVQIK